MVSEISVQILEKQITNNKIHQTSSSGNSNVSSGNTYMRIQVFQLGNFANSPKNVISCPSVY